MSRDELEDLSYLWDGSEGWVLWATYYSEVDLKVVFAGEHPSVQELLAGRKLLPQYRDVPVHQVKARIGALSELSLGRYSTAEADPLHEQAQGLGLNLIGEDASHIGYSPVRPEVDAVGDEGYRVLLIEDDELAEQVKQKMLEAGVPIIEHVEVD